jgi:hypothetical protein
MESRPRPAAFLSPKNRAESRGYRDSRKSACWLSIKRMGESFMCRRDAPSIL